MNSTFQRIVAAAALLCAALCVPPGAGAAPSQVPAETSAAIPAGPVGSVYVPLSPCRVLDTRNGGGGKLASQNQRNYQVAGSGAAFASQGGQANGCGLPANAVAVEASVTAVSPDNGGFFRAWPTGTAAPIATFLNFTKNQGTTNTGAITLGTGGQVTVKNFGGPAHYVIDVQGYFAEPTETGALYVPLTPCRVLDTRNGGGKLSSQDQRNYQTAGAGPNFATQGGRANGCGVPDGAAAIEASITAVSPDNGGFFRAWPTGTTPPNATFLNFTKNQGTTNTGAITLAASGTNDLTVKNFGGPSHYVIDVQGYFANAADLPPQTYGAVYVPGNPCRVLDTRSGGGGKFSSQDQRNYQTAGTGPNFAAQGGRANGCGIPDGAAAIEASITAVSPDNGGFFRAWPAGATPPNATFLNFTKNQGTTNTGAITLTKSGTNDLTIKNFGGPAHYVIDIQGHYQTVPTTRITDADGSNSFGEVSADGSYFAFASGATNLTPEIDINQYAYDIFIWERATGTTTRITNGNGASLMGDISDGGDVVVFSSAATNLVPRDDNGQFDIFLWRRATNTIERITNGNGQSQSPTMNKDGSEIAFRSTATNLDPKGGEDGNYGLFVWNDDGITELLDASAGIGEPDMDSTGQRIVFASYDTDLVPGDTNSADDIFKLDRDDGLEQLTHGNVSSFQPRISGDGSTVVFSSYATDLDSAADPNANASDVFRIDENSDTITRISTGNGGSSSPTVDHRGSKVAFVSKADDLVPGDPQAGVGSTNAFLWDRATGHTERISAGDRNTNSAGITGDARFVALSSSADNMIPGNPSEYPGGSDFYLWGPRT